jgi:anti-sigma B factor antagonist
VDQRTAKHRNQDIAVLTVRGDIDLATAPALLEVLHPVLERDSGPVVIDLSEVPFMDSTGVHVLIDTFRRLRPQNRRLAIACREGGQIHRLLALTGVLDALPVHRSRESAVIGGDELVRSEPTQHRIGARRAGPATAEARNGSDPPSVPVKHGRGTNSSSAGGSTQKSPLSPAHLAGARGVPSTPGQATPHAAGSLPAWLPPVVRTVSS